MNYLNELKNQLTVMPKQIEAIFDEIPENQLNWKPNSWEGIPSEEFSAIEQICHLRDIEVDGYQMRFQRIVNESNPNLVSIDGYDLAKSRNYQLQNPKVVLREFSQARQQTIEMINGFSINDFSRKAVFEGSGEVILLSLIYFLRSHDLQHLSGLNWLIGKFEANKQN